MTRSRWIAMAIGGVIVLAIVLFVVVPRVARPKPVTDTTGATGSATAAPERKITATLFYVGENGLTLDQVQREVTFGEAVADQARFIVQAQIQAAPAPYASAIPSGTKIRAVYVSEKGDAFVDLTGDLVSGHTGGALDELFAVYAIVNAVTVNLPAIQRVQILVDGKEVDTLAGHIDLRHPLSKNLTWTKSTP
jgi:hypothetical protein